MDLNIYLVEWWAKERLDEIRTARHREHIADSFRRKSSLRVTLGLALIRVGQRLQGHRAGAPAALARQMPASRPI
jgi:hypothetical protein